MFPKLSTVYRASIPNLYVIQFAGEIVTSRPRFSNKYNKYHARMPNYNSSLLRVTLPSLTSFTNHHRELIESAVNNTYKCLVIYVSCKDIDLCKKSPLKFWDKVNNLLNTFYVSGTKTSYKLSRPFLEIEVIFENWCGYSVELEREWEFEVFFGNNLGKNIVTFPALYRSILFSCNLLIEFMNIERPTLEKFNKNRKAAELTELPIHVIDTITPPSPQIITNHHDPIDKLDDDKPQVHPNVAVGGTFDHLHVGHKILLTMSAWITNKRLICGVTGDSMLTNKKYKEYMEPIDVRIAEAKRFLNIIRRGLLYEVVPIYDIYGPTITDPDIQALVVSKETVSGAYSSMSPSPTRLFLPTASLKFSYKPPSIRFDLVNEERKNRGLNPLEISVIEVISSSDSSLKDEEFKKLKLSSTFIREMLSKNNGKSREKYDQ
ncbi:16392_t:CDS:2 [Acaulospora colombiana]|uniref:16392_t:CDS:1 n=1 Tax=Acaulospora colombiana TaxID=27376 RepID=A0ACA9KEP0_9GLOM|nr:16392_t:CDS:2 [Acaulospora colombiana]